MDAPGPAENGDYPLAGTLFSPGPASGSEGELALFGQFIGTWALTSTAFDRDGVASHTADGSVSFGWILGGQAVQDVWWMPSAQTEEPRDYPSFRGTTIRFYDARLGAWLSTWIEPIHGVHLEFISRIAEAEDATGVGDVISETQLLNDTISPQLRWSYSEITRNSFTWTGEEREAESENWRVQQVMHATRLS